MGACCGCVNDSVRPDDVVEFSGKNFNVGKGNDFVSPKARDSYNSRNNEPLAGTFTP